MTELDTALDEWHQNPGDPDSQSRFYDLVLNGSFYVPTHDYEVEGGEKGPEAQGNIAPLVIEAEGNDYLMLFDSKERLVAWAEEEVPCAVLPGHALALMSTEPLHWALNVGTEYPKQFVPEEISWLRDAVERCNAEAQQQGEQG